MVKVMAAGLLLLMLSACSNPLSDSSRVEDGFEPGLSDAPVITNPFTKTWTLNSTNAAEFTLSSTSVIFGPSSAGHLSLSLDDSDDNAYGFGAALNINQVIWSSVNSAMQLTAGGMTAGNGSFESRVFSAAAPLNWTGLEWKSKIPAGKPLPNNKVIETVFASGNVDMSNNVLLLHMDEASWTGAANEVLDSSGSGNHATRVGAPTTGADGKFARRGEFTTNGQHLTIPHSANFDTTSALTLEAWLYPTPVDNNVRGIVSKRVSSGSPTDYAFALFSNTPNTVFFDINASTLRWNTGYSLVANVWQHIAVVFDGSQTAGSLMRQRLYVNGVPFANANTTQTSIQATTAAAPVHIGSLVGNNTNTFVGRMDEVAIYDRALTSAEIAARYQRGRLRIKLQARGCTAVNCAVESYIGPDGTAASFFTEGLNTANNDETAHSLSLFNNKQFFQYKATLESDNNTLTPQLASVQISPDLYDSGYPTVTSNTGVSYLKLESFSADTGGGGQVHFQLSNGTNWYYWNGSAWTTATMGFAHSNLESDITNNISTFHNVAGPGTLTFRAFFSAGATSTTPATLSSVFVSGGN